MHAPDRLGHNPRLCGHQPEIDATESHRGKRPSLLLRSEGPFFALQRMCNSKPPAFFADLLKKLRFQCFCNASMAERTSASSGASFKAC